MPRTSVLRRHYIISKNMLIFNIYEYVWLKLVHNHLLQVKVQYCTMSIHIPLTWYIVVFCIYPWPGTYCSCVMSIPLTWYKVLLCLYPWPGTWWCCVYTPNLVYGGVMYIPLTWYRVLLCIYPWPGTWWCHFYTLNLVHGVVMSVPLTWYMVVSCLYPWPGTWLCPGVGSVCPLWWCWLLAWRRGGSRRADRYPAG